MHQFHILPEHTELRVESEAVVLVHPQVPWTVRDVPLAELDEIRESLLDDFYDWLSPTQYCPILPGIADLVRESEARCDGTALGFANAASQYVHKHFTYKPGATHVHSSVRDSLETRSGVCQDFSHLLLAMLRSRGLPARYVSGYLIQREASTGATEKQNAQAAMERVIGGQASHAWVQVYIPQKGWIGLDPTVGEFDESRHILVARGRDYGDLPPVRGVYKGHAGQSLSVDVLVRPAVDDEGAELLQETAAAPPPKAHDEQQQQQQQ